MSWEHFSLKARQNSTSSDAKYTGGLSGVDQPANEQTVLICLLVAAIVAALLVVVRTWQFFRRSLRHQLCVDREAASQKLYTRNSSATEAWLKRVLFYAPLWGVRHCRDLWPFKIAGKAFSFGVVPRRKHALVILAWYVWNTVACFSVDYSLDAASTAALRGRSGWLAVMNFIPTVLFALRNNPLIWAFGISFDTFNLYHRWLARLCVIESFIHTAAFSHNWVRVHGIGGLGAGLTEGAFHYNGLLATIFLIIMAFFAWCPIRHAWYETFVHSHRIMFWIVLVTLWKHLEIGHLPQLSWLQISLTFYLAEIAWRVARVFYFNFHRQHGWTRVTVEAREGQACRLEFEIQRDGKFLPGSFAHVYIPKFSGWIPITSHPFSIAWTAHTAREDIIDAGSIEDKLKTFDPYDLDIDRTNRIRTTVSFVTRVRDGFTKKMFDAADAQPCKTITTWGAIEGPYGHGLTLESYGTAVLFAGGVGITAQLMHARHLLAGIAEGTVATQRVVLVWSIPEKMSMQWVDDWMRQLMEIPRRYHHFKIMVFVTKPREVEAFAGKSQMYQLIPGRCLPQTILDAEIKDQIGALAVTCCGPGPFMDAVRDAVRRRVQKTHIDYFEDAFTY